MRKILLVDDDIAILIGLEELLPSIGYKVVGSATSGDEAIDMARKLEPDLILMDIKMPGHTDGIAASKIIKNDKKIDVIFITSYADVQLIERAKKVEPLGYIHKPFSEEQITASLNLAFFESERRQAMRNSYKELNARMEEVCAEYEKTKDCFSQKEEEVKLLKSGVKRLICRMEEEKNNFKEDLRYKVRDLLIPLIAELNESRLNPRQEAVLKYLKSNLNRIVSPFPVKLPTCYIKLTPTEIRIVNLIKRGKTSKEISRMLNVDLSTVVWHRKNVRKKLNVGKTNLDLKTYLLSQKE